MLPMPMQSIVESESAILLISCHNELNVFTKHCLGPLLCRLVPLLVPFLLKIGFPLGPFFYNFWVPLRLCILADDNK